MFYPPLTSVHAEARYNDLQREAQAERLLSHARQPNPGVMAMHPLARILAFLVIRAQWQ